MNDQEPFQTSYRVRPATDDVRRRLILEQHLRASQAGPPPSRLARILRTATVLLALGATLAILAVIGVALFLFTLGIAVAATAVLLLIALYDRLRGRPARRVAMPAVFIRRS